MSIEFRVYEVYRVFQVKIFMIYLSFFFVISSYCLSLQFDKKKISLENSKKFIGEKGEKEEDGKRAQGEEDKTNNAVDNLESVLDPTCSF